MNKQSTSISFVFSMIIRKVSLMAWARSLPQGLFASGHIPQWISPVWMNFMSASCQMLSSRTLRCCVRAANICPLALGRQRRVPRTPRCCGWVANFCPLLRGGQRRVPRTPRCCVRVANLCPLLRGGQRFFIIRSCLLFLGRGLRRGCWTFRSDT